MAVATAIELELAKWEQHDTRYVARDKGLAPGNPYAFRPYPKMLYKAHRLSNGKWSTTMPVPASYEFQRDQDWDRACQSAEAFGRQCQTIVNSEDEHRKLEAEGWRETQHGALEFQESLQKAVSDAAAEANYRDRNMSEKALAEKAEFEADNFGHQPVVPEASERKAKAEEKRGRRGAAA